MNELNFPIYIIEVEDEIEKYYATTQKEAIEIYDKLTTKINEEYGTTYFHYSTWEEEDPEGYIPDCPIESFACVGIVVYKITDVIDLVEMLGCEKYGG